MPLPGPELREMLLLGAHKRDTVMYETASQQSAYQEDSGGLSSCFLRLLVIKTCHQVRTSGPPPFIGCLWWRACDNIPFRFPASRSIVWGVVGGGLL